MLIKAIPINIIIVTSFLILRLVDDLPGASAQTLGSVHHTNTTTGVKFSQTISIRKSVLRAKKSICFCNTKATAKERNEFSHIFTEFWPYSKIERYLEYMAQTYPNRTTLRPLGKTFQNNTIYSIKIGLATAEGNNIVFIEAGTHAKEWGSIMMALYVIHALLVCDLYKDIGILDWIIMPVVNPDGYDYSFKNRKHRMWSKNRRDCEYEATNETKCNGNCGVDLNKNFPYFYSYGSGASSKPCSDFYEGPASSSEPETSITVALLQAMKNRIKLYIAIHTYGALISYPYAYIVEKAENHQELETLAQHAAEVINNITKGKQPYAFGNYAERVVPESGTSLDFVKGALQVQYAYNINLRGPHNMTAKDILPTVSECFPGICAMAIKIYEKNPASKGFLRRWKGYYRRRRRSATSSLEDDRFFRYILGAALISLLCLN